MNLFAVFQEGVYRHTCVGIFIDYPTAVAAADDAAASDCDDYHSYDVFMFELNKPNCEEEARYSVRKSAALAKRTAQVAP